MSVCSFDDSTQDFPVDTRFAQIGILRNPTIASEGTTSTQLFTENTFTSCDSLKLQSGFSGSLSVGDVITQTTANGRAVGYVVSFNEDTSVIKYIQDRSLYFNPITYNTQDYLEISTQGKKIKFESSNQSITGPGFIGSLDTTFSGSTLTVANKTIELGVEFTNGVAQSEINKPSGEILYLDNRPLVPRNPRQKEDVKIILEF